MVCLHSHCYKDGIVFEIVDTKPTYCPEHAWLHGFCIGCMGYIKELKTVLCDDCLIMAVDEENEMDPEEG